MKIIQKMRSYLLDDELMINIYNDKVHLVNYQSIIHFDSNSVMIKCDKNNVVIKGHNLVVSKLMNNEVLVSGTIKELELR